MSEPVLPQALSKAVWRVIHRSKFSCSPSYYRNSMWSGMKCNTSWQLVVTAPGRWQSKFAGPSNLLALKHSAGAGWLLLCYTPVRHTRPTGRSTVTSRYLSELQPATKYLVKVRAISVKGISRLAFVPGVSSKAARCCLCRPLHKTVHLNGPLCEARQTVPVQLFLPVQTAWHREVSLSPSPAPLHASQLV